jgi:ABC-2 type transport system ATP-binding protein
VSEAETLENNMVRVRFAEDQTPHEAIVQAAVKNGWGLYQIAPDQTSLEDVFVQLTYQDAAVAEASAA